MLHVSIGEYKRAWEQGWSKTSHSDVFLDVFGKKDLCV